MTAVGARRRAATAAVLAVAVSLLGGCVVQDERPMERIAATKATVEVPEAELLDIGIRVFDPNIPESTEEQEKKRVFPDVRKAESRYMPVVLRDTLEGTGQWGQVRVLPANGTGMDLFVDGKILESTGRELRLAITAVDATGRVWLQKEYASAADTRAYKDVVAKPKDPFENIYNTLSNDLLAARDALTSAQRVQIREVSDLRFAAELAPYAFKDYLAKDRKGLYTVTRLPADGDPMLARMEHVRERDYSLVDTLNEYYANFGDNMAEPYTNWRKYTHEALETEADLKRQALTRKVLGAVAVVGGVMAGSESNSSAGSAASTAAVIGGIYAIKSGFDMTSEIKIQGDSLKQLGDSFQSEVAPMVVDVEGRTLQLKGSAEEQYAEWRRLLKELYENETGLPATTSSSAADASPARGGDKP